MPQDAALPDEPSAESILLAKRAISIWQSRLLDLTKGNRLLRFRVSKLSTVPLTAPDPATLFDWLVVQDHPVPLRSAPENETAETDGADNARTPSKEDRPAILSPYPEEQLHSALYNLRLRAKASLEERGVNILHVAFGFLAWKDPVEKEVSWRAPLVLAPVRIERPAPDKHTLASLAEDVVLNPTLAYKLESDFGLKLPELPDEMEGFEIGDYWHSIQEAALSIPEAHVEPSIFAGLFSFLKIPMYQDLARYGELILKNPLVGRLAGLASTAPEQSLDLSHENDLDQYIDPHVTFQVLDADSSQQEALLAAREGAHLLIQGPPGTGKSQTITNLIAQSLGDGNKILFVSEKAAALEVVKRNLDKCGIGDACLELHSHRADKKKVLAELDRVLNTPMLTPLDQSEANLDTLVRLRDELNAYVHALHKPRFALDKSAFHVHGQLASVRAAPQLHFALPDVTLATEQDLERWRLRLEAIGVHAGIMEGLDHHPWCGLKSRPPSFAYAGELAIHLVALQKGEQDLEESILAIQAASGLDWPDSLSEIATLFRFFSKYKVQVLAIPGTEWRGRFQKTYRGWSRLLSLDYWNDANRVKSFCRQGWTWDYSRICDDLAALEKVQTILGPIGQIPQDSSIRDRLEQQEAILDRVQTELGYFESQFDGGAFVRSNLERSPEDGKSWSVLHLKNLEHVDDFLRYVHDRDLATAEGLGGFIDAALSTGVPVDEWPQAFLAGFYRAWLDEAGRQAPELAYFTRFEHEKRIGQFRSLDIELLKAAAQVVDSRVASNRPQLTERVQRAPSAEISILARELHKQRRIKPLRRLFGEAAEVIQSLKPCFMMSPLAVSQFLVPDRFHFDIVIFDEASQVKVEDAVGCIFRGKQLVVAGDSKQLPPTRFFDVLTSDEEWDEEEEQEADVYESILDALGTMPDRVLNKMLQWHYRSRNEELIAFSNKNFYENHLYTFPHPGQAGDSKAVDFVYVPGGVYERGGTRRNLVEAQRVVDLVVQHYEQNPDWSLAVVAFSDAQRDAIQQELDRRLATQQELSPFFEENGAEEPFRIKNLELIQGDERDVIIFSVGYGRDESGNPPPMHFGPLNKAGGRRRLNVAVTRARHHVTVVSSIQPEELARSDNEGVRLLKEYMLLARDGLEVLFGLGSFGDRGVSESPFEESVYGRLVSEGLTVHRQVGCSGYRIDLAVVDPKSPERYCLGIECDGAMYHSARTARDRDRLRQQILEGLGWHMHRVWSRDWNANPDREVRQICDLVERYAGEAQAHIQPPLAAVAINAVSDSGTIEPANAPAPESVLPEGVVYYQAFGGPFTSRRDNPHSVAEEIARIVECEGPTAVAVINDRLATAWKAERSRTRVRSAVKHALELGQQAGRFRLSPDRSFVLPKEIGPVLVRISRPGAEPRPLDEICPEEICAALALCLKESGGGASEDDLVRLVVRLYGHARAIQRVAGPVREALEKMIGEGELKRVDGMVRAP